MDRRKFVTAASTSAFCAKGFLDSNQINLHTSKNASPVNDINIIGPKEGYSTQVGTLVSMLNWMRNVVIRLVAGLSQHKLDFTLDSNSNTIGAMLWHLAATERYYQIITFDGKKWDGLTDDEKKWQAASNLGEQGRTLIHGYDIDFYLNLLENVRQFTLDEFRKRGDDWLMEIDYNFWGSGTNNYCKWFHVCEHESNHNGQIKYIKKRIVS